LGKPFYTEWKAKLLNIDESITIQSIFLIAQTLSRMSIIINVHDNLLKELLVEIEKPLSKKSSEKLKELYLLTIGEIAQKMDSNRIESKINPKLMKLISENESEEISHIAATTLGCVAIGNINQHLPILLNELTKTSNIKYSILLAIEKIISNELKKSKATELNAEELWESLFKYGFESLKILKIIKMKV
jgi:hypothetical protein